MPTLSAFSARCVRGRRPSVLLALALGGIAVVGGCQSSGGETGIDAAGTGGRARGTGGSLFHNVSLPGSGGACTIGVNAGSAQATVDDFVLSDG